MSKRHSSMFIGLPSSPSMTRASTNNGRPSTAGSSTSSSPVDHFRSVTSPGSRMDNLSVPNSGDSTAVNKRKSFDAGIRPLNLLRSMASSASLNNAPSTEFSRSLSNSTPPINTNVRGRESPRPYSPLRDYFSPEPGSHTDSEDQVSPISPPNGRNDDTQRAAAGRARSASSSAYMAEAGSTRATAQRPTLNLDRMPTRSSSLAIPSSFEALEAESPSNLVLDRSPLQNRPPNLSLNGSNFRSQHGPWDGVQGSPEPIRHSALSGIEFELSRPGSVPPSPSHFVDVPHSIESGTDTEAESEDNGSEDSYDRPPALPPKEAPPRLVKRPDDLRVDVTQRSFTPSNAGESEGTPESSPIERTSHATFIAPALPPIRISMGGADFSDLYKMGDSAPGKGADNKLRLDLSLTPPDSAGAPMTPRSDITVLGSADHKVDETPVRRGQTNADRSGATSPSSSSSHDYVDGPRRSNERARYDPTLRSGTPPLSVGKKRERVDSNAARNGSNGAARITVTAPGDGMEALRRSLQEAVISASELGATKVALDPNFVQSIINMLEQQQDDHNDLKRNLDGMKVSRARSRVPRDSTACVGGLEANAEFSERASSSWMG